MLLEVEIESRRANHKIFINELALEDWILPLPTAIFPEELQQLQWNNFSNNRLQLIFSL